MYKYGMHVTKYIFEYKETPQCKFKVLSEFKQSSLSIRSKTKDGEFVADVTGTMIMMLVASHYWRSENQQGYRDDGDNDDDDIQLEPYDALSDAWNKCRGADSPCPKHKWFTSEQVDKLVHRARNVIESFGVVSKVSFEVPIRINRLSGKLDCLVEYTDGMHIVFEFKCVIQLNDKHMLQLKTYLEMLNKIRPDKKGVTRAILFNLFNNEGLEIFQSK